MDIYRRHILYLLTQVIKSAVVLSRCEQALLVESNHPLMKTSCDLRSGRSMPLGLQLGLCRKVHRIIIVSYNFLYLQL